MRWKTEAEEALKRRGFEVVDTAGVDDWQGWGVLLGKSSAGTFAILGWSYGSCSGCDAYEDLGSEGVIDAISKNIEDGITDEAGARDLFEQRKGW